MLTTWRLYLHSLTIQLYRMCGGRDGYDWIEKTRRRHEVIFWRNEVYVFKRVKPTRCYTMVYWTLWFDQHVRALLCPSSGACDYTDGPSVMAPHLGYGRLLVWCLALGLSVRVEGCCTITSCNIPLPGWYWFYFLHTIDDARTNTHQRCMLFQRELVIWVKAVG
jgi:hypothetical protein